MRRSIRSFTDGSILDDFVSANSFEPSPFGSLLEASAKSQRSGRIGGQVEDLIEFDLLRFAF
jgi:hypothetical protein